MHRVFYLLTPLVFVLTFLLPACDITDEPPGEYRVCCDDGEPAGGGCPADSCPDNEAIAEAQSALSIAASAVYTITDDNAPALPDNCNNPAVNTWCECGTVYTDPAPRCNEPGATVFFRFPAIGCEVSSASLSYQATAWGGATTATVHRILRPVVDPAMGQAGACASSSVASWYRSGPEAWTLPGAKGDGTDRSSTGIAEPIASGGLRTETIDVSSLVAGCDPAQPCVLGQYMPIHVFVYPGTAALIYECAGPPAVCGDGAIEGAEGCDDGDVESGDGCSATCAVEAGFACDGEPSTCATSCGDGVVAGLEECDDGNTTSADGCSSSCASEVCTCQ